MAFAVSVSLKSSTGEYGLGLPVTEKDCGDGEGGVVGGGVGLDGDGLRGGGARNLDHKSLRWCRL